jgi:hypothetical protein
MKHFPARLTMLVAALGVQRIEQAFPLGCLFACKFVGPPV